MIFSIYFLMNNTVSYSSRWKQIKENETDSERRGSSRSCLRWNWVFFPITHSHKSLYTTFGYVLIVQCLNHDLTAQVWKTVLTFWIRMGRFTAPHWVSWTLLEGQTRTTNYSCWRMTSRNGEPHPFLWFLYGLLL